MQKKRLSEISKRIVPLLIKHQVKRAGFFGSLTRDDFAPDSDIDLVIEFKGKKSLLDLVRLKLALEEHLGRKVDVLTYKSLHPLLKDAILEEHVQIL
ncbi:MAG: nucleotidyltransferase family protein [bacterium]